MSDKRSILYVYQVGMALSNTDVLVNTAIPTSNIIFVNIFYLLVYNMISVNCNCNKSCLCN